jgi:hypothetical protein
MVDERLSVAAAANAAVGPPGIHKADANVSGGRLGG